MPALPSASTNPLEKVIFFYFPSQNNKKLDFRFASSVFEKENSSGTNGHKFSLNEIITMFYGCLEKTYSQTDSGFRISISQDNSKSSIVVAFDDPAFEETEENAGRLVGVIEFVKTMILAMA